MNDFEPWEEDQVGCRPPVMTGSLPVLVDEVDYQRFTTAVDPNSGSKVFDLFMNERVFGSESSCNESILGVECVWVDGGQVGDNEGNKLLNEYAVEQGMVKRSELKFGCYKFKVIT